MTERHVIAVPVDNEPGVLARAIGLFSGRGYNIESPAGQRPAAQRCEIPGRAGRPAAAAPPPPAPQPG